MRRRQAFGLAAAFRRSALHSENGGGGQPPAGTQQEIADNQLGTSGWATVNSGATPDPSWTTVSVGGLQAALNAATSGDTLYLAGGNHDASDAPYTLDSKQLTILGNYDGTTRITGHKSIKGETWVDNADGTWTFDAGAAGLDIRPEDLNHDALQGGVGNPRHAWPQQVLKNENVLWHYATTTSLGARSESLAVEYDLADGQDGYVLDETNDLVHINFDPALADSIYLAYSQGLFHIEGFAGFVMKGVGFAFDALNNRGTDPTSGITGTHPSYCVVTAGGQTLVEYCDFDKNHAGGIRVWSGGSMVRHSRFRWQGMNGLALRGDPRSVLLNSEVARNGWACNMGDVGGGMKMKQLQTGDPAPYSTPITAHLTAEPGDSSAVWDRYGSVVYRIWTHDNYGAGIWYDGDCIYGQVEYNLCEDDWDAGVHIEVSEHNYVRYNHIYRCGHCKVYEKARAGIKMNLTEGADGFEALAEGNYVEDCDQALLMERADRSSYTLHDTAFRNNHVKTAVPLSYRDHIQANNVVRSAPLGARGTDTNNQGIDPDTLDLVYAGNYYEMSTRTFEWANSGPETEDAWQTRFPSDSVGSIPAGIPALSAVGLYDPTE